MAMKLSAHSDSDRGRVRSSNQDVAYAWVSNRRAGGPLGLLMVADGMGGGQAGELASDFAVNAISQSLVPFLEQRLSGLSDPSAVLEDALSKAIDQANAVIFNYAQRNVAGSGFMGTTIACVVIHGAVALIAHVGDSRVYLLRRDGFKQLTEDHSAVAELINGGLLGEGAVFDHPGRNILTRALGVGSQVEVDLSTIHIHSGDRLLLCSDGLWGALRGDDQLQQVLRKALTAEMAVRELIGAANEHGGHDNIGVVVCDVA